MRLAQGDGQGCRQNVDVGVSLLGSLVGDLEHLGVGYRIHSLLAPLGVDVRLIPDLDVLYPSTEMIDKGIDKIAIVLKTGGGCFGTCVLEAGPGRSPVQAGDDLQSVGPVQVHNLVEFLPTAFAADRIDELTLAKWLDLGPGELLLGPAQASLPSHLDGSFPLPGFNLAGQKKVSAIGVDISVGYCPGRAPGVPR